MTPLGSAGGSQERVRVVAVEVAVGAVSIPGATKKELYYKYQRSIIIMCLTTYPLVLFLQQLKQFPQCCLPHK